LITYRIFKVELTNDRHSNEQRPTNSNRDDPAHKGVNGIG